MLYIENCFVKPDKVDEVILGMLPEEEDKKDALIVKDTLTALELTSIKRGPFSVR